MIAGADVRVAVDYLEDKAAFDAMADLVVYTGAIDSYFGYCFGELEYRSLRFEHERLSCENYQGVAVMNFTDRKTPYTRIIEHKHFEFGRSPRQSYPESTRKTGTRGSSRTTLWKTRKTGCGTHGTPTLLNARSRCASVGA